LTTRVSRRTCHLQVSFKFHHSKQQPPPWEWTAWAARRPLPVLPPAEGLPSRPQRAQHWWRARPRARGAASRQPALLALPPARRPTGGPRRPARGRRWRSRTRSCGVRPNARAWPSMRYNTLMILSSRAQREQPALAPSKNFLLTWAQHAARGMPGGGLSRFLPPFKK
jgi:hypothetical protein